MSPTSSGSLEVEKYIGACLISQSRPKAANIGSRDLFFSRVPEIYSGSYANFDGRFRMQGCNGVDRWAGGMPLISFANHQKRNRRVEQQADARSSSPKVEDQHNPLARLAVHTQGAPLILTKTFNNRRNKVHKSVPASRTTVDTKTKGKPPETQSVGVDAVSVTSDESSGSANSDNCLPRIIKPRKRRKKDRKPLVGHPQDGFSTDSASPDIDTIPVSVLRPYTSFIFEPHLYGLVPETLPLIHKNSEKLELYDVSETPQLHHNFEDVEELDDGVDINGNQSTTVCQCRYCDPSGQIWDVDRNCYSPFLTAPIRGKSLLDTLLPRPDHSDGRLVHSMSSLSLEGEKGQKKSLPRSSSRDLEVSTEIVTSLNGHRDIEIKFFSTSSAQSVRGLAKSKSSDGFCVRQPCDRSVNSECKFLLSEE